MKCIKIKLFTVFLCTVGAVNIITAQNISGPSKVCAGESYWYLADPAGGNHKTWALPGGTIVTGTIHSDEIEIMWNSGGEYDLSWIASHIGGGGPGGYKLITVIEKVAPSLSVSHPLGSGEVTATAGTPDGATKWKWTISGFGYSSPYVTTTSTKTLNIIVPDSDAAGSICVQAYFSICGEYGPSTCQFFP